MVPQGSPPGTGMSPVATQGTPTPVWGSLGTPLWGQKPLPPGSCCGVCPTSGLSGINLLDEAFALRTVGRNCSFFTSKSEFHHPTITGVARVVSGQKDMDPAGWSLGRRTRTPRGAARTSARGLPGSLLCWAEASAARCWLAFWKTL